MILTFSKEQFVLRIPDLIKKTTIREDKLKRWKVGMKIHFWKGNPRNTRSNPFQFGEGVVSKIDRVVIDKRSPSPIRIYHDEGTRATFLCSKSDILKFAISEGFNSANDMFKFFDKKLVGRLITWKNCTFDKEIEEMISSFEKEEYRKFKRFLAYHNK